MRNKNRLALLLLLPVLLLLGCSNPTQKSESNIYNANLTPVVTAPSIDLSKFPALPTTAPADFAATQPSVPESVSGVLESRPESSPESKPESNHSKALSSKDLSIYERLKNAPHTW